VFEMGSEDKVKVSKRERFYIIAAVSLILYMFFGVCIGTHAYPGVGQSSSVMLDQNIQTATTAPMVNNTSNMPPLILPLVP
jgi:hypothetical protein